jgi:hypothetical protein
MKKRRFLSRDGVLCHYTLLWCFQQLLSCRLDSHRGRALMRNNPGFRPALPVGWFYPDAETARSLHGELQRELPTGHLLAGLTVETFAWREHATDDVLFRHVQEPKRFVIIHLSWLGRTEINAEHPTVEFDGTFEEFLVNEEACYGLKPLSESCPLSNHAGRR